MAGGQQLHGLLCLPPPRPVLPISARPPPCRARPPLASLRILEPSPPVPKKRPSSATAAKSKAAAVLEDENGAREEAQEEEEEEEGYVATVGSGDIAGVPARHLAAARAGLGDPVFYLLTFVAITTSLAFTGMVAVAIPTMLAMRRAANSFTQLADAALEELPSTMAAVRLSGMEISDLTLELSDLSALFMSAY
ncbi:hypothetical protein BRADI_4g07980v3 [Brachypodium distachyon]|uniref:Uncharacterized protein n=1 Tax=Brachypodium distachyon TaxID=15368 RepID=A0A0Q3H0M3_BRADI|nr:hypothetical protein BRADI_4g07980v3 [Brachypodium distachyon]